MSCATYRGSLRLRRCLLSAFVVVCAGVSGFAQSPETWTDETPLTDSFELRIQRLEEELSALKRDRTLEMSDDEIIGVVDSGMPVDDSTGVVQVSNWRTSGFRIFQDGNNNDSVPASTLGEDPDLPNLPPGFRIRDLLPRNVVKPTTFPTLNWSGFLQLDTGIIDQNQANIESVGQIAAESGLRRVRLRVDGNVRANSSYVIDLDFAASGHPSFRNVMLAFHDIPVGQNLQMGYFKQSVGMQAMTSARELRFMERTLPFAFDPFRQTGVGFFGNAADRRVSWALSTFGFPTNSFGVTTGEALGTSLSTRITGLPFYDDEGARLLHMGMGYCFGTPADNQVEYAIQPGFFVSDPGNPQSSTSVPTFVNTGEIPARSFHVLNAELATNLGSLSMQTEATFAIVDQIGGPTTAFSGAYASMGYVLTGEKYRYNRRYGIMRSIIPQEDFSFNGGIGAWELTAGWAYIDLNNKNIQGGTMWNAIIGVNWYVSPNGRFQLNIIPVHLVNPEYGPSDALVMGVRGQVEF